MVGKVNFVLDTLTTNRTVDFVVCFFLYIIGCTYKILGLVYGI